jgi:hypothetical protein
MTKPRNSALEVVKPMFLSPSSSHFGFGGGRGAVKWCGDKR